MDEMDVETEMTRAEAAAFFRDIADKLDGTRRRSDHDDEETPIIGEEETVGAERADSTSPVAGASSASTTPESMTVIAGGESATVVLPERLLLDVEVGSRSGLLDSGADQHVAFELAWEVEEVPEDDSIEVV